MENNYDVGAQEDFDNMTRELGVLVKIYPRDILLTSEGQEGSDSNTRTDVNGPYTEEYISMQELDSEHEMIASGQMNIGSVHFNFLSDTVAEEEGRIFKNGNWYKILEMTKVRGINTDLIISVKAFGKKVPER